ncbi:hypothetical protein L2137_07220 [Corynebacterium diphtheriae bv. mitis]|uniref:hypothetical protein n=1 Tax=Corynebacterium TaxID=1716 RepID=UPI0008A842A1|nr:MULTISPECIES: hypothetical protein [Corynebacterium]MCM0169630.1 hypothetical protein [Corynebacterium diphtheriae bv. mitis]OHR29218.1 hypothetical protein HMPREF2985_06590 [Corynebacterium sp. HMSC072B09]OHR29630.1 hypothetical protein HMPREF2849_10480 [Corynebacterium sp. HMSC073B01]
MTTIKQRWTEIDNLIAENKTELKGYSSHKDLNAFAEKHSLMTKEDFPKFKHCLLKIGVRYDALRAAANEKFEASLEAKAKELDNITDVPVVCLWSAAVEDDGAAAFAVVDVDDTPVWYGRFFDDDRIRIAGDLVSAEQSAADKAVWLAHKALEAAGKTQGRVLITTTCPELDIAALRITGARFNIGVDVHVDDADMRAVDMAEAPGYKKWQDNDLAALVEAD